MHRFVVLVLGAISAFGCASSPTVVAPSSGGRERGIASWYGEPYHGRQTASGEIYDMHEHTAAHRSLAFGTEVEVVRRDTGASVKVRINDRGPFVAGRIIDLSYAAARDIALDIDGVAPVELEVLQVGHGRRVTTDVVENTSCFWVQVGAFGDPGNAERAVETLRETGEKAMFMEGPQGLSRVRVGPFQVEAEAIRARDRLIADWPPATVVACGG